MGLGEAGTSSEPGPCRSELPAEYGHERSFAIASNSAQSQARSAGSPAPGSWHKGAGVGQFAPQPWAAHVRAPHHTASAVALVGAVLLV